MTIFAQAVLGPDGRPFDQIRLTGVTATGHHGVLPHEREEGQEFSADVVLHLDTRPAATGDALADTVSYAVVAEDVHAVLAGSPADLVETVAERIAAAALTHAAVVAVDVRVHKPQAPIAVPFDDVEVAIRRDRVKTPVVDVLAAARAEDDVPADAPSAPVVALPVPLPAGLPVPPPLPVALPVPVPAPAHVDAAPPVPPAPPEPEPVVDRLEVDPVEPVEVVLAIGANLGDAQATLRAAVTDLDRLPGIQVTDVSPLARTTAVGGPEDQPDYLNAVLVARTTLSPRALLRATQAVENAHGRVREERWGPRTLDVDIVRYGSLVARADDLELPHPRAHERAFVLVPWAEVQPDADLPGLGGGPVARLAETAPDRAGIRWLALDWLTEPSVRTGSYPAAVPEGSEPEHVAEPAQDHAAEPAPWAEPAPAAQPDPTPWAEPAEAAQPGAGSGGDPGVPASPVAPQGPAMPFVPPHPAPVPTATAATATPVAPPPFLEEPAPAAPTPFPPFPAPPAVDRPGHVHTPVHPFAPVHPATPPVPAADAAPEPTVVPPTAPALQPVAPTPAILWQPVAAGSPEEAEPATGAEADGDAERWIPYDPDQER